MRHFWIVILVIGTVLLAACASSKLSPEGEKVRVVTDEELLANCEHVSTLVISADSFSPDQEAQLRENIARNRAADKKANAIIAVGDLMPGEVDKQEYAVYFCK